MTRKAKLEDVLARDSASVEEMFGGKQEAETSEDVKVLRLPWTWIRANAANFYAVDDVEELVNSIEMHGLLDPIVVTKQDDGSFLLISGHRRFKAWGILREKDPVKYQTIPAIVREFASGPMAELALIMANSSARKLSMPELSQQAQRVQELLYELKEQGYSFPGRMRDQVAKACNVSATKLARLKVIRDSLSESWKPLWESGELNESVAYELAQGSPEIQERIFKAARSEVNVSGVQRVRKAMEGDVTYDGTQVKKPGCGKCKHGDAFLRHDMSDGRDNCLGRACCVNCEAATRSWDPCPRACSLAKKSKTDVNARKREAEEQARLEKQAKLRQEIRESAQRLLKAADAAGVDDSTKISQGLYSYVTVEWLRKAAGDEDIGYYYRNEIAPCNLNVPEVAKTLKCSADYVCELTDELRPQGGAFEWSEPREYDPPVDAELTMTEVVSETDTAKAGDMQFRSGKPKERTLAWCAFVIDGTEMTSIAAYWPHLDAWCFEHGARIDAECVGWYPVPDWRGVLRNDPKEVEDGND
jgi:ParB family chromosome partitioning protein